VTVLQATALVLVALAGTTVVLLQDPRRQVVAVSFMGLVLAVLFFSVSAPDVALSQLAVGAVALPMIILLAIAKTRRWTR
jgi:uncharacterized MnhB-related membrane protein